jgi:membrane protein YdbS with pleckstrin-like domain
MSPLIQYAIVLMISGSVVALVSVVIVLGIVIYRYRKHRMLREEGSIESQVLLRTKLDDALTFNT